MARPNPMDETLQTALAVAGIFDRLGVRWFLGGSLASSLQGVPRATLDADIVADMEMEHVQPLLRALGTAWYADEPAIRAAVRDRAAFNLIHYDTALKVDVFVPKRRKFEAGEFQRIIATPVGDESDFTVPVCAAEDIVAAKLEWFRLGGEISERQWRDITGVLRINAGRLNLTLLRESASELGVTDLLDRALSESQ